MRGHRLWQDIGFGQDASAEISASFRTVAESGLRLGPGLHRLPIIGIEMGHQPRRDQRLADIGIGACDEKALQSG